MNSTEERNKVCVQRWMDEIWHKRNFDFIDEYLAPEAVVYSTAPEPLHGPEGTRQFVEALVQAFPDVSVDAMHIVAEGDWTATHFRATGTHQGEFMGIPPTLKQIDIRGASFQRFHEGRVVEEWEVVNELHMLQQLGVVQPPG